MSDHLYDLLFRLALEFEQIAARIPPEQKKPCCKSCGSTFDMEDYREYFLECGHSFCLSCLEKQNECPTCGIEYTLPKREKKEGEECIICNYVLNINQRRGEVKMTCYGNKLCLECAVKSLTDKKEVRLTETQGIPGLVLPEDYIIKGKCPFCREENPKNKEELFFLLGVS